MYNLKSNNDDFVNIISSTNTIIQGTLITLISILIVSLLSAGLLQYLFLPVSSLKWISLIVLFCGILIGSYRAAKIYGKNGMIIGIVTGISVLIIISLFGLSFQTVSFGMIDLSMFLIKFFGLMLFGAIGGILGINLNT